MKIIIEKTEIEKLDIEQQKASALLEIAEQMRVETGEQAEQAKHYSLQLAQVEKNIDSIRKKIVKPLNDEVKRINSYAKKLSEPLQKAKTRLKDVIFTWQKAEQEKINEQKNETLLDEIDRAIAEGQTERPAGQRWYENGAKPTVKPVLQTRRQLQIKITDSSLIPREYLMIDKQAIEKAVRAGRHIPGVKAEYTEQPVLR